MTTVSFDGQYVCLDGKRTYAGRVYDGHPVEGLLFNVRAVQAIFDDAVPQTSANWAYPDTGAWDPDRNTAEFCAALAHWRDHGVLAVTVNLQGGGPLYVPEINRHYDNNGFTPEGELKPAYADRLARVIRRTDALGMVTIVGFFYWTMLLRMANADAIWRAAREACTFLASCGHRNVLVELANEIDVVVDQTPYAIFRPERQHEMLSALKAEFPSLLFSTSGGGAEVDTGRGMPPPSSVRRITSCCTATGCALYNSPRRWRRCRACPRTSLHQSRSSSTRTPRLCPTWRSPGRTASPGGITIKAGTARAPIHGKTMSRGHAIATMRPGPPSVAIRRPR